jgi:hypothetical protein
MISIDKSEAARNDKFVNFPFCPFCPPYKDALVTREPARETRGSDNKDEDKSSGRREK